MDCEVGLYNLERNSIDLIVTDPDYGYNFMGKGKEWGGIPKVEVWKKCLRVLKPGAFAFIFSAPRQDVNYRMVANLEKAGFNIKFTSIYWAYASSIPKSRNISKSIDKRLGIEQEIIGQGYGTSLNFRNRINVDHKYRPKDYYKDQNGKFNITIPVSPQAKALNGAYGGFQPKPAVECVIVCMKPLSKSTYVDQALTNQKGITWLEDCRIPVNPVVDDTLRPATRQPRKIESWDKGSGFKPEGNQYTGVRESGRFPANLLVSNNILDDGKKRSQGHWSKSKTVGFGEYGGGKTEYFGVGEKHTVDSFSRYYSLDLWWEKLIQNLPRSARHTFPFLLSAKAQKNEKWFWCKICKIAEHSNNEEKNHKSHILHCYTCKCDFEIKNKKDHHDHRTDYNIVYHITQKPRKIIAYLLMLGSRPKDVVLDLYIGSGTTPEQCKMLGRQYIGFEIDPISFTIAKARVQSTKTQHTLDTFFNGG